MEDDHKQWHPPLIWPLYRARPYYRIWYFIKCQEISLWPLHANKGAYSSGCIVLSHFGLSTQSGWLLLIHLTVLSRSAINRSVIDVLVVFLLCRCFFFNLRLGLISSLFAITCSHVKTHLSLTCIVTRFWGLWHPSILLFYFQMTFIIYY